MPGELDRVLRREEFARSVIATMAEGVVVQDASAAILACNASAERLLGLSAEQMAGRTSLDPRWRSVHEDGSEFPGETHPAVVTLRTGEPQRNVVMGVYKPDGTLTWIVINTAPLVQADAQAPRAVLSTFGDITAQKAIEHELRLNEHRYRTIVETTSEGIWTAGSDGRITFANARIAQMLRTPPEALAGATIWEFLEPEDHATVRAHLAIRAQGISEAYRLRMRRSDGTSLWVDLAVSPMLHADGRPGSLAMIRDVTQELQLEAQLTSARRLESIGRLAGGVAHDFNNLLTAILASLELVERSATEAQRVHFETMRVASERAARLTGQLLAFARKQVVQLAPVSVNAMVRELEGVLRRLAGEHIEVVVSTADDAWVVLADVTQLEQVLVNLVANARDAMPDGGRLLLETVNVTLDEAYAAGRPEVTPGEYVMLSVTDSGVGLDDVTLNRIFEPFFTTKSHGTGLGLASCYGTVKQLGGHIWAYSEPGRGTTFKVYLPRASATVPAAPAIARATVVGGSETILLVEDDELVRSASQRGLAELGYDVHVARDGEAALEVARRLGRRLALVITDVVMPKLGGRELVAALRETDPGLEVLFVSGYTDNAIVHHGVLDAGVHFLPKPYTIDGLARRIRTLLT